MNTLTKSNHKKDRDQFIATITILGWKKSKHFHDIWRKGPHSIQISINTKGLYVIKLYLSADIMEYIDDNNTSIGYNQSIHPPTFKKALEIIINHD